MLFAAAVKPGAVTSLTTSATLNTITLNWSAPTEGTPPFSYEYRFGGTLSIVAVASWVSVGSNTSYTRSGLGVGQTYYFEVRATNAGGIGPATAVTRSTTSGAPGGIGGATGSSTSTTLSISAGIPPQGVKPMTFRYRYRASGAATYSSWVSLGSYTGTASFTITGLTASTLYSVQWQWTNNYGTQTTNYSYTTAAS